MPDRESLSLTIADLGVELRVTPKLAPALRRRYAGWLGGTPSLSLDVSRGELPDSKPDVQAVLTVAGPRLEIEAPGLMRVEADVERGTGVITYVAEYETEGPFAPTMGVHAALRLLVSTVVTRRGGLMLHAAGVRFADGAAVFAGPSEAGKSTTAAMFPDERVLSDELVAVDVGEHGARAHATPFSGTHDTSPKRGDAPLIACFDLAQADRLTIEPLATPAAAAALARCVALLPGDADTEHLAFASLGRLVNTIPCRRLRFPLDPEAVARAVADEVADLAQSRTDVSRSG